MTFDPPMIWMTIVFVIGYALIAFEDYLKVSKATIALMMAIICWIIQYSHIDVHSEAAQAHLSKHLANISQVVFFLLGALTIVEIVNTYNGFKWISDWINVVSKRKLLWLIGFLTFFLSSILDNLTTTIVMVTLLRKLVHDQEDRWIIGGGIVIAANAGGAWTPIGDVTTTMLWIGGQISSIKVMQYLFLPSIACLVVSLFFLQYLFSGNFKKGEIETHHKPAEPYSKRVFTLALGALIFVPIFKGLTGLPPFMGVLFGLSVLWIFTDLVHPAHDSPKRVQHILGKIDLASTLFFLGILLCINALETGGVLDYTANLLDKYIGNTNVIGIIIGIVSAIIDNVPLVAATMGMYDLATYPMDSNLWQIIAFCAGTGGSMLIIGSAAGVVYMGLERVGFMWYLKRISGPALAGYFAGIGVYWLTTL